MGGLGLSHLPHTGREYHRVHLPVLPQLQQVIRSGALNDFFCGENKGLIENGTIYSNGALIS